MGEHHPFVGLRAIGKKNGARGGARGESEIGPPIVEVLENGGGCLLQVYCRFLAKDQFTFILPVHS